LPRVERLAVTTAVMSAVRLDPRRVVCLVASSAGRLVASSAGPKAAWTVAPLVDLKAARLAVWWAEHLVAWWAAAMADRSAVPLVGH
jgi:hypothetical protein